MWRSRRALVAQALLCGGSATLVVHSPASIAGTYEDTLADFSPTGFFVSSDVAVAPGCPCGWLAQAADGPDGAEHVSMPIEGLSGKALLVPSGVCSLSCSAEHVACAAHLFNATIAMLSDKFDMRNGSVDLQTAGRWAAEERAEYQAQANRTGCADHVLLATFLTNATTTTLLEVVALVNASAAEGAAAADELLGLGEGPYQSALRVLLPSPGLNVSVFGQRGPEAVDCAKYTGAPAVYALTLPLWIGLALAWLKNTYRTNLGSARDLHRLMCWVPMMQIVHGLLSLLNYAWCPWDNTIALMIATFWAVVTILKEPVLLLCLLLVAKGWCITRHSLPRREVCIAGTVIALLYGSVSVQMSMESGLATTPMVVMYLVMLVEILWSIANNLRVLRGQLLALATLGIEPRTTPAHTKYRMFQRLGCTVALYALLELVIHVSFTGPAYERRMWVFLSFHQTMELLIAALTGHAFRARPFPLVREQVEQIADEIADQMLPSFTTVELAAKDELYERASGFIGARTEFPALSASRASALGPERIIVLNPGDTELPQQPRGRRARAPSAGSVAAYPGGPAASVDIAVSARAVAPAGDLAEPAASGPSGGGAPSVVVAEDQVAARPRVAPLCPPLQEGPRPGAGESSRAAPAAEVELAEV